MDSSAGRPIESTPHSSMTERRYRISLILITLTVFSVMSAWALVSHAYRTPDEPQHVNSVMRLAHGGGWPPVGDARMSAGMSEAMDQAEYLARLPGSTRENWGSGYGWFVDVTPTPDQNRIILDAGRALDVEGQTRIDQMSQHPPLYYGLLAGGLTAIGMAEDRWDLQLLALRLMSILLTIPVVPLIAGSVRVVTDSQHLALGSATVPLFVPQFGFISGSVTNDALMVLTGSIATYASLRVVGGDLRMRWTLLAGVAVGAGLLTKAFMAFSVPMVLLAYLFSRAEGGQWLRRVGHASLAMAVAFAIGGWWWIRNYLLYGQFQPSGMNRQPIEGGGQQPIDWYFGRAWDMLTQSFWGRFGWLEVPLPGAFVVGATLLALALITVGLFNARRLWAEVLTIGSFAGGLIVAVAVRGLFNYQRLGQLVGLQGRYFFAAFVALTVLAALGVWGVLRRSERSAAFLNPTLVVVGLLVSAYGLYVWFAASYVGPGESQIDAFTRWVQWSPGTTGQLAAMGALLALAPITLVVNSILGAWKVRRSQDAQVMPVQETEP
ncbi:DUF2142 domain-containing protein [Pseudactinotalea sp. Z1739]|uniref:DUF2142 domain-containing protein n=1 Tax=Pseudactinotalea sp. Z1739 TaxID=3413028 RepID=UPI003C7ADFF4